MENSRLQIFSLASRLKMRGAVAALLGTLSIVAGCALSPPYLNCQTQPVGENAQLQTSSQDPAPANSSSAAMPAESGWNVDLSPYIWFAGTHGTVGAFGRDASVHASPSDLLSHFNFGIMGASEARFNHFLLFGDLVWIRLSDSHALPFPGLSATSVDVRVGQLVWTSKVGYRLIDRAKLKADANVGVRYWHLGQTLSFNPSILGLNISPSQSWADIVVGGRIELPVGPKASISALGDVGGWNATAKLDYQFAGLLKFKVSRKWTVGAGYRYLFVDYRTGRSLYNLVTPGAVLGVTYSIGGHNTNK
jgi:hypothetical protein